MKFFNKISVSTISILCVLSLAGLVFAATAVDLGTAEDFAVLAGSGITDTNPSVIVGDVGLDPTGGASIPGLTCAEVTGSIIDNDAGYTGGNAPGLIGCLITDAGGLTTAKADLVAAYNNAAGQVTTGVIAADLGGQTLTEGVYEDNNAPDSLSITGTLTLDAENNPDAVFIFKSGSTLTTAAGSDVVLINGAQACNVFWQVTSSATLGVGSLFVGNILALVSITDDGGSTIDGRLLAQNGAVTLNDSSVTVPTCLTSPTLTVTKVVINDDNGESVVGDFTLMLNGVAITSGVATSTPTGAFTVTESGPGGYAGTFSGDCNANGEVTMTAGNTYTCTLTNNDDEASSGGGGGSSRRATSDSATLRVIKRVINDNGGTATSSDFTLSVKEDGDNVSGSPKAGTTTPGTLYRLSAGTYVVSENVDTRYTQRFSGDCSANGTVTLSAGDDETCTITNDDVSAAVIPSLPNTGFPSEGNIPWLLVVGVLVLVSGVFYVVRKKQTA